MTTGDCTILNTVWGLLWNDPKSSFYFPNIAKNGLEILGIKIDPFDTVDLGDLPQVTMFEEPVLGYMKLALTANKLQPLSNTRGSGFTCKDGSSQSTEFGFTLEFSSLELSGKYTVSAGGGVVGCAIASAAGILGGRAMGDAASPLLSDPVDPGRQNIDLALWYQGPLMESDNGQTLLGAYDTHQDSIYDLQQNPAYQQAALRSTASRQSAADVTVATAYYRNKETGLLAVDGDTDAAPTIGTPEQYASGQLPYAYMLALAKQKVDQGQDPDGQYARLYDSMVHFMGSVTWVQQNYPGPRPVGGQDGILDIIAKANPDEVHTFVMENGPYPIADLETGEILSLAMPRPLDYAPYRAAGAARAAKLSANDSSSVDGAYTDRFANLKLTVGGTLTLVDGKIKASVNTLTAEIPTLSITLHQSAGWWPGLYDKVTNWLANDTALNTTIKNKLTDALSGADMRKRLTDVLNGALSKLEGLSDGHP